MGAITQFLEGNGTLHFTFGLVEMAIYQMPDGARLVQPRIVVQSSIVRRFVVTLAGDGLTAVESELPAETSDLVPPELQKDREKFQSFWREFLDGLKLDNQAQPISEAARNTNQFFRMPSESKSWVSAYLSQSTGTAGVYLRFARGPRLVMSTTTHWRRSGKRSTESWASRCGGKTTASSGG